MNTEYSENPLQGGGGGANNNIQMGGGRAKQLFIVRVIMHLF